jgi:hypothetical protein
MSTDQPRDGNGRFSSESVPLREHVDALLDAARELQNQKWCGHDQAHTLIATALGHQEIEAAEWRKAANEWRSTVGDLTSGLASKYVTREQYEQGLRTAAADARARQQWLISMILAAMAVTVGIATLLGKLLGY